MGNEKQQSTNTKRESIHSLTLSNLEIDRRSLPKYGLGLALVAVASHSRRAEAGLFDIWDIIAKYIMPIVEAAYGNVISPVTDSIKEYYEMVEKYVSTGDLNALEKAASEAKSIDARNQAEFTHHKKQQAYKTFQTSDVCANQAVSESIENLERSAENASRDTVATKVPFSMGDSDRYRNHRERIAYLRNTTSPKKTKNGQTFNDEPLDAKNLFMDRGFRSKQEETAAMAYIELLIGNSDVMKKLANGEPITDNKVQAEFSQKAISEQFQRTFASKVFMDAYYLRKRNKSAQADITTNLTSAEHETIKPFVSDLGMSQLDVLSFEVDRAAYSLNRYREISEGVPGGQLNAKGVVPQLNVALQQIVKTQALKKKLELMVAEKERTNTQLLSLLAKKEIQ